MVDRTTSQLVNFAVLFDKKSPATTLAVGGVCLGEHAEALRSVPLSQASPKESLMLDPTLRTVDQRRLMREYGYVDADLHAVDSWDAWGF